MQNELGVIISHYELSLSLEIKKSIYNFSDQMSEKRRGKIRRRKRRKRREREGGDESSFLTLRL